MRATRVVVAALGIGALAGCNVALGGGAAALVAGSAFLASRCYDRVHITIRDGTGSATCDARVTLIDEDGDERTLTSCYTAALTAGTYQVRAQLAGLPPLQSSIVVGEHEGCPYYTHNVELSFPTTSSPVAAAPEPEPPPAPKPPEPRPFESLMSRPKPPPPAPRPAEPAPSLHVPANPAPPSAPPARR